MILMLFIDGLGVGSSDAAVNPLALHPDIWPNSERPPTRRGLQATSLDACLGVAGLPQSATGQTALLTGVNAPRLLGRHMQGFPSKQLIEILRQNSLFLRLKQCGLRFTFANAYRHPEDLTPASRLSVTSHALKASGQPFRTLEQLKAGQALYHDFTHRHLRQQGFDAPELTPMEAAQILIDLAAEHDFTLYEHFLSDVVAHHGTPDEIRAHVSLLSTFIRAALDQADERGLQIMITSDHGNIEDPRARTHTRNPVPLLWTNPSQSPLYDLPNSIAEVTPWILKLLRCSFSTAPAEEPL